MQELNDNKKLIDTKIAEYAKSQEAKQTQFTENSEELRGMIVDFEFQLKGIEENFKSTSKSYEKMSEKVHEVETKYGRVARQANDLESRVEALEKGGSTGAEFTDKPLQMDQDKDPKDKFQMSDLFKDFQGNLSIQTLI